MKDKNFRQSYGYKTLIHSLMALEKGKYSTWDIHKCCDYIGWISKFHKLPKDDIDFLADFATHILVD